MDNLLLFLLFQIRIQFLIKSNDDEKNTKVENLSWPFYMEFYVENIISIIFSMEFNMKKMKK